MENKFIISYLDENSNFRQKIQKGNNSRDAIYEFRMENQFKVFKIIGCRKEE